MPPLPSLGEDTAALRARLATERVQLDLWRPGAVELVLPSLCEESALARRAAVVASVMTRLTLRGSMEALRLAYQRTDHVRTSLAMFALPDSAEWLRLSASWRSRATGRGRSEICTSPYYLTTILTTIRLCLMPSQIVAAGQRQAD